MITKAKIEHVNTIHKLLSEFAKKQLLLPRSKADIYENIRDFFVYLDEDEVLGCCALHIVWEDLAEVRSLAVLEEKRKQGVGKELVLASVNEAKELGIKKLFALTYVPDFFEKLGFHLIDKHQLPRKIWTDCVNCPYFPDCDEKAVILEL